MTRREPDPEGGGLVGREARPRQQADLPASEGLLHLLLVLLLLPVGRLWGSEQAWVWGWRQEVVWWRRRWNVECWVLEVGALRL